MCRLLCIRTISAVAVIIIAFAFASPVFADECKECGKTVQSDWKFCPNCGEKLLQKCLNCGKQIENETWKFCPHCRCELKETKKAGTSETPKTENDEPKPENRPEKKSDQPEKPSVIETSEDHAELIAARTNLSAGLELCRGSVPGDENYKTARLKFLTAWKHLKNYHRINPDDPRITELEESLIARLTQPGNPWPGLKRRTGSGTAKKEPEQQPEKEKSETDEKPKSEQAEPSRVCEAFVRAVRLDDRLELNRIVDWNALYENMCLEKDSKNLETFRKEFLDKHFEKGNRKALKEMERTDSDFYLESDSASLIYHFRISPRALMKRVYHFKLVRKPPGNWFLTKVTVSLESNK
ncbi:MAG: zinc ribbon domain-containing protein [Planctomycetota bacterium]|jgi:RNA polymerase subunit RPABC4/transcription elongation factor Spt4